MAKSNKSREYVFLRLKPTKVIHPQLGAIEMENHNFEGHIFEVHSKCSSRLIVQNTNPFSDVFPDPEIIALELFTATQVPDEFLYKWLKLVQRMKDEYNKIRREARNEIKASVQSPDQFVNLLKGPVGDQSPPTQSE